MSETYSDPYAPARAHVELAVEALNLSHATAERLRARHEGAMILDPLTGTQRYIDGAADTGSWLRSLEQREPSMLGKSTVSAKPVASADLSGATFTELAVASRRGDAAAIAEISRRLRVSSGTPEPTFNLTTTMAAAKAGDDAARRQLDTYFTR